MKPSAMTNNNNALQTTLTPAEFESKYVFNAVAGNNSNLKYLSK